MSALPREKATEKADLPHRFQEDLPVGSCAICHEPAFDSRHLAWEKAQADDDAPSTLPRETGV